MGTDADLQAAHAALFKRVSDHLAVTAGKLTCLSERPKLSPDDVARLFIGTGCEILRHEFGPEAVVNFLRAVADGIEAGAPVSN